MEKLLLLFLCCFLMLIICAQEQKVISDCTVTYGISVDNGNTILSNSSKIFYVRGNKSRTDLMSPTFTQSIIYDANTGAATILKEVGGNKYMSAYSAEKLKEENKKYQGIIINFVNETKKILGYECKKAIAKLKDGTTFSIYYATAILPQTSENPYEFKNIPGFVLQYETIGENNQKIIFKATDINLYPVPHSKFEIPTSGYRMLP